MWVWSESWKSGRVDPGWTGGRVSGLAAAVQMGDDRAVGGALGGGPGVCMLRTVKQLPIALFASSLSFSTYQARLQPSIQAPRLK